MSISTSFPLSISVAARTDDILGESPTWCASSGCLFWVDLRASALRRLDPFNSAVRSWPMPALIGAVVPRASGGVVVALQCGLYAFDPQTEQLSRLSTLEQDLPDNRLNDAKCDAAGRLLCGSMWDYGAQTSGALYRVGMDGSAVKLRSYITIPNAIAFSPDGGTLYFADTRRGTIECADYDIANGEIGPWRIFAAADAAPGRPDGATVDAQGFLWNARYQGGCLARFAPDGKLDRIIELPVSQPTSCAFGGADLSTLYVTTATQKLTPAQRIVEPLAGSLLALDVGVAGLIEPGFAG